MVTEATESRKEATELMQTHLHDVLLNYRSKVGKYKLCANFCVFFFLKEVLIDE